MRNALLPTVIAAALACPPAGARSGTTSEVEPELIIPMITIEREFFITPMCIRPKSALEKHVNEAGLAKSQGKYEEARLLYLKALKESDKSYHDKQNRIRVLLSCEMAECLYLSGRNKSAEQQYFQSLNASRSIDGPLYSLHYAPLMGLGYLYLRTEHYADALQKFQEALDLTKEKTSIQGLKAREGLGLVYAKQNKLSLAKDCFETAVKDIESEASKDEVYEKSNDTNDDLEGAWATNYANLAYCEFKEEKLEEAEKHYATAEGFFGKNLPTECKTALAIAKYRMSTLIRMGHGGELKELPKRIADFESRTATFVKAVAPENFMKPEVATYMANLQKKIKAQWHPKKHLFSNQLVVKFKITRDGSIKNLTVIGSSGNAQMDEMGLKAVEEAAPFSPPPPSINKSTCDVQFTFDYNVLYGRR